MKSFGSILLCTIIGSCLSEAVFSAQNDKNFNNRLAFPSPMKASVSNKRSPPADMSISDLVSRERKELLRQLWLSGVLHELKTRSLDVRGDEGNHFSTRNGLKTDENGSEEEGLDEFNVTGDVENQLKQQIESVTRQIQQEQEKREKLVKILCLLFPYEKESFLIPPMPT